jgi:hypothetical protein
MALGSALNYSASPPLIVGCVAIGVILMMLCCILTWRRVRTGRWVPIVVLVSPDDQASQELHPLQPRPTLWDIWTTQHGDWAEAKDDKSKCIATTVVNWAHIMVREELPGVVVRSSALPILGTMTHASARPGLAVNCCRRPG